MTSKKVSTASEFELGKIHAKLFKIYDLSLDAALLKLAEGEDPRFAVDVKLLGSAQAFISRNNIVTVPSEMDDSSDLKNKLDSIKKAVPFKIVSGA